MGKRAVLYARVSGDDRKNVTSSIDGQLADCRKYAAEKRYRVVGEYFETPDKQTSGADWLPELDKVLKLAQQGGFDVLIVRELDRLARNRFKQLSLEIALEAAGVFVEYVIGQYADTAEGRLLKGLMSEFAEYEREKIKERTRRGKLRSVAAGNVTMGGSYAPYGYEVQVIGGRRVLVINKEEAAIVRLIFDLYVNHFYSLNQLCDYLAAHKVAKPGKGNNHKQRNQLDRWSAGTLNNILNNETYTGRWHFRKSKMVKDPATGKSRKVARPREEWILLEVPAIISEATFQEAQARRTANRHQKATHRKYDYLLGGMLKCGHCGNHMTGMTKVMANGRLWGVYKCNTYSMPKRYGFKCENCTYKVEMVDGRIWEWVRSILLSPDELRRSLDEYQQVQQVKFEPQMGMLATNEAKLVEMQQQRERLIAGYAAGVLTLDDMAPLKVDLDKQINDLGQAIQQLRGEVEPQILTADQIATIEQLAAEYREAVDLTDEDTEDKRHLFKLLDVQATLSYSDGRRWADVQCKVGMERIPVDYNVTSYTVYHCTIRTRLLLE